MTTTQHSDRPQQTDDDRASNAFVATIDASRQAAHDAAHAIDPASSLTTRLRALGLDDRALLLKPSRPAGSSAANSAAILAELAEQPASFSNSAERYLAVESCGRAHTARWTNRWQGARIDTRPGARYLCPYRRNWAHFAAEPAFEPGSDRRSLAAALRRRSRLSIRGAASLSSRSAPQQVETVTTRVSRTFTKLGVARA